MGIHKNAERKLSKCDPILARIIKEVGACTLEPDEKVSPYESLLRSIVYQQLHGKAAATILGRFLEQFSKRRFPKPEEVLHMDPAVMRSCGLSASKSLAIKDLALKTIEGVVPTSRKINLLSDEEIIERLTQIRGVGIWTVQMMLMFKLGRLDVIPHTDFGVQKGFSIAYAKAHPTPKELLAFSEIWRPYRSIASWYMWRVVDVSKG